MNGSPLILGPILMHNMIPFKTILGFLIPVCYAFYTKSVIIFYLWVRNFHKNGTSCIIMESKKSYFLNKCSTIPLVSMHKRTLSWIEYWTPDNIFCGMDRNALLLLFLFLLSCSEVSLGVYCKQYFWNMPIKIVTC